MIERGILIVDDDEEYRNSLANALGEKYQRVYGAATGTEAIDILTKQPLNYQFAVVDHDLGSKPDGIETTRQLVKINPNIYPVIFTNIIKRDVDEFKYEALKAGAYRYLEWSSDRGKEINEFVEEIEQLENLQKWIANFFEARATAPSLLTQLDIGTDIIDRHYKVWFMNDAMRRISGIEGSSLPKGPCADWHGFGFCPCPGCLVAKSLDYDPKNDLDNNKGKYYDIFLSPFKYRKDKKLIFLKVWTQPVADHSGKIITGTDGKPLAVMESIYELTNSPELKAMTLKERLDKIVQSLYKLTKKQFSKERCFEYVRIYFFNENNNAEQITLKAAIGMLHTGEIDIPINLRSLDKENLKIAEKNMIKTGHGSYFNFPSGFDPVFPGQERKKYIYWPIIENQKTTALIEVGGDLIEEKYVEIIKPYAVEIFLAIEDNRKEGFAYEAEAAKAVSDIEYMLQTTSESSHGELAKDQLKIIIQQLCKVTDSNQYVVRYREGNNACLLKLKIPEFSEYENEATLSCPVTNTQSWSCRTISAGVETFANTIENNEIIQKFRSNLSESAQMSLKDVHALCYEPLILEGTCIGSLGFHSKKAKNYDAYKRAIIRSLAKRATMALHDYLVIEKIRDKTEADALSEILGLVLHNIKTPLATAQFALDRFQSMISSQYKITPQMSERLDTIKNELLAISHVREEVLKLKRPWESRIESVELYIFLKKITESIAKTEDDITIKYFFPNQLKMVFIDKAALKLCFEVLVQNAIDSIKKNDEGNKSLQIMLRNATEEENSKIESSLPGIAIEVIDNGSGIPPNIVGGLFKKMKSSKANGLGMGLLHCRAVALSAQGNVFFEENYNPGAKFILVIPYKTEEYK